MNNIKVSDLIYGCFENFNMDLFIENKHFISIIGSNKCGKTTLFKILTGIIPTNNVVSIDNLFLNKKNVNEYIKKIGVVFKANNNLFLYSKVSDELEYSLLNLNYNSIYRKKCINEIIKHFNFEKDILEKEINDLNFYEKQKLMFCLALVHRPKYLFIDDDVLSSLNYSETKEIIDILKKLNVFVINFSSTLDNGNYFDYFYILSSNNLMLDGDYKTIINNFDILKKGQIDLPIDDYLKLKLSNEEKDILGLGE